MLQQLSTTWIQSKLEQQPQAKRYWVAFSGGLDSRVLLQLCAELQLVNPSYQFSAIHVNHQLQDQAPEWVQFCRSICTQMNIHCVIKAVNAQSVKDKSPEQAARDARRIAFSQVMSEGDVLLTAHHLNDQAETVLLRLFRGSGITGLAGIRPWVPFSAGWLVRPLLDISREQLQDYANRNQLKWIEDPSNQSHDYDRNYLRHAIIPQLEQHWPGLQNTLSRNAQHCLQADILLSDQVGQALKPMLRRDGGLSISDFKSTKDAIQNLLLRAWFAHHHLSMPTAQMLEKIKHDVIMARIDATPCLTFQNNGDTIQCRRYQNQLVLLKNHQSFDFNKIIQWNGDDLLELPAKLGYLKAVTSDCGGIDQHAWKQSTISIRFRSGGERCQLPGRTGHRSLKAILQDCEVPPWERDRIPLIYLDDDLAAIGTLVVCAPYYVGVGCSAMKIILQ